jgi:tetratricopeptide (TPR) repeat protein
MCQEALQGVFHVAAKLASMRNCILAPCLCLALSLSLSAQPANRSVAEILASGEKFVKEKQLDQALEEYRAALLKDPKSATALYNIGWIYNEQNKFDSAARFLKQGLEKYPGDYNFHNELGYAHYKLGNQEGAIASYTRATELKPDSASAWLGLADVLYEMKKDAPGAAAAYEKAIANGASGAAAFYRVGWAYNDQKQFEKALPHLKKAAELEPRSAPVWLEWGYSLLRLERSEEAVQALTRALSLDNKLRLGFVYLGRAYIQLGQKDKAKAQAEALRSLDPVAAKELDAEIKKLTGSHP